MAVSDKIIARRERIGVSAWVEMRILEVESAVRGLRGLLGSDLGAAVGVRGHFCGLVVELVLIGGVWCVYWYVET